MTDRRTQSLALYGRVFLRGQIEVVTGMHIGGAAGALEIGGVDSPVIRDPLTGRPYVPGSSLKGKLRSLSEKLEGLPMERRIGQSYIHSCEQQQAYDRCPVCPIFGVPGEVQYDALPTRLVVRDTFLTDESAARLEAARTDLPYTEVKWEVAIDRLTSAASPRQLERVPAGSVFGPAELVYTVYDPGDLSRFRTLVRALQLVEDDYLGGMGSRGGGKVRFTDLTLFAKARDTYILPIAQLETRSFDNLDELLAALDGVVDWLGGQVPVTAT